MCTNVHMTSEVLKAILNKKVSVCPSSHCQGKSDGFKCTWPAFKCPHTPKWQLFSSCLHVKDSMVAAIWHEIRRPFQLPYGIPGHSCVWEPIDHHMAGCTLCGGVHRCDTDRCEEILEGEPGFHNLSTMKKVGMRCPTEQTDDGSIVCRITAVCIRTCSYGVEYELISRQGLASNEVVKSYATCHQGASARKKPCAPKSLPSKNHPPPLAKGSEKGDGVFRIRFATMKNDFQEENISSWIKKLISMVVQVREREMSRGVVSCRVSHKLICRIKRFYTQSTLTRVRRGTD